MTRSAHDSIPDYTGKDETQISTRENLVLALSRVVICQGYVFTGFHAKLWSVKKTKGIATEIYSSRHPQTLNIDGVFRDVTPPP